MNWDFHSSTSGDDSTAYDPLSRITRFRRGTLSSSGTNGSTLDTVDVSGPNISRSCGLGRK